MATLTVLRKKIAALEAQVARVTKAELGGAIAKIRKLMDDHGVTIEHLMDTASHRGASATKVSGSKKPAATKARQASKGARPAKYQDPKSGATWSGLGRIPAWIASATSRDDFLIDRSVAAKTRAASPKQAAPKKTVRKAAAKKVASASKVATAKKVASGSGKAAKAPAPTKRIAARKAAAKGSRQGASSKRSAAHAQGSAAAESAVAAS